MEESKFNPGLFSVNALLFERELNGTYTSALKRVCIDLPPPPGEIEDMVFEDTLDSTMVALRAGDVVEGCGVFPDWSAPTQQQQRQGNYTWNAAEKTVRRLGPPLGDPSDEVPVRPRRRRINIPSSDDDDEEEEDEEEEEEAEQNNRSQSKGGKRINIPSSDDDEEEEEEEPPGDVAPGVLQSDARQESAVHDQDAVDVESELAEMRRVMAEADRVIGMVDGLIDDAEASEKNTSARDQLQLDELEQEARDLQSEYGKQWRAEKERQKAHQPSFVSNVVFPGHRRGGPHSPRNPLPPSSAGLPYDDGLLRDAEAGEENTSARDQLQLDELEQEARDLQSEHEKQWRAEDERRKREHQKVHRPSFVSNVVFHPPSPRDPLPPSSAGLPYDDGLLKDAEAGEENTSARDQLQLAEEEREARDLRSEYGKQWRAEVEHQRAHQPSFVSNVVFHPPSPRDPLSPSSSDDDDTTEEESHVHAVIHPHGLAPPPDPDSGSDVEILLQNIADSTPVGVPPSGPSHSVNLRADPPPRWARDFMRSLGGRLRVYSVALMVREAQRSGAVFRRREWNALRTRRARAAYFQHTLLPPLASVAFATFISQLELHGHPAWNDITLPELVNLDRPWGIQVVNFCYLQCQHVAGLRHKQSTNARQTMMIGKGARRMLIRFRERPK